MMEAMARCIQRALDSGQIGNPVSARIVAYTTPDPDLMQTQLGTALALLRRWLGSEIGQVHAGGGIETGEISLLVRFEAGQSALISSGVCGAPPYVLEALLFGTKGIVSWDSTDRFAKWREAPQEQLAAPTAQDAIESLTLSPARRTIPSLGFDYAAAANSDPPPPLAPTYGVLLVAGEHTHQPAYAAAFAASERCRLIGLADETDVSDDRRRRNQALADRLGIPNLPSLSEALARSDVHIVSICAEPERRAKLIVQAAAAGKHLYLDKPLCVSPAEASRIVTAVREAAVHSHMYSQLLGEPVARARQIIDSGVLGPITAVHADLCFAKGPAGAFQPSGPRHEHFPPRQFELPDAKRELTNIGVYSVLLLLTLLRTQVRTVNAVTGNYFFEEHQRRDVEDFGQVLLELEGGLVASTTAGRTGWRSSPGSGLSRLYLLGTRGSAVIDAQRPRAEVWAGTEPWRTPPRNPDDPMGMWELPPDSPYRPSPKPHWFSCEESLWQTDVNYFLDCLQQGRRSQVTMELAAAATEVLSAAYQSAAAGETIVLG